MTGMFRISSNITIFVMAYLYVLTYAKNEDYTGWKSYYIHTSTTKQVTKLDTIRRRLDLDFLSPAHVKREAVVLVKPEQQQEFMKSLDQLDIKYRIHVDDLKSALDYDDEMNKNMTKSIARDGDIVMSYDNYQRLETIEAYLHYIAAAYPKTTTLVTTTKYTFEGRPLRYLKISTTNFGSKSKPVIFIEGGMHAREWISPPAVTYAIKKLTENVTEPDLLNHFDWVLLPVANPDGYHFTFNGKRMWRKTRSLKPPNDLFCPGVDGNRNFDIAWNTVDPVSDPCSATYPGTKPFSEVETKVVRDVLREHHPRMAMFLAFHSFGSLIMHPWSYNLNLSYNYDALRSVGLAIADAFSENGPPHFPPFVVGSTAEIMYKCSGLSSDYAHHIGVPLAFTFELPGFSPTLNKSFAEGFHLEPQYIKDVCRGTWAGIVVAARRAKTLLRVVGD